MKIGDSLGAKIALVCVLCLAALAAVAAGINAFQVRMLKEKMLDGSRRLAEQISRDMAEELQPILAEANGDPGDIQHPVLRDRIQFLIKQDERILAAAVVDVTENGDNRVLFGDFRDEQARREMLGPDSEIVTSIEPSAGDEAEDDAIQVILQRHVETVPVGAAPLVESQWPGLHLAVALRDSEAFLEIEEAGKQITRRVAQMTALLSAALIAAFLVVWALVRGQTRLIRENEKLDRMAYVGTLASGLAHEVRNPLNAMSVNLGVIEEDLEDPREDSKDRLSKLVHHLETEVRQLDTTLTDFLAFALPREGGVERVSLADAVQRALDTLSSVIDRRGVQMQLDLDESIEVEGNPVGVRQVFHNLALNAVQAMRGEDRRLIVRIWREGARARASIEDTGEGVAEEDMERIFEPFQSGAKARGGGFGLPIARRIVRDHSGRLWIEKRDGPGAAFHLEFPLPSTQSDR